MTMTLVETVEIGAGGASSIEFTDIPQDGVDLVLKLSVRRTDTAAVGAVRFNNVATSNYTNVNLTGTGSSVGSSSGTSSSLAFTLTPSTSTANTFGNAEIYISNYTSGTNKSISVDAVEENNATDADMRLRAWLFTTSSAISKIDVIGAMAANTVVSLYKITAGDSGQLAQPKAAGGTTSFAGGYWYHTFTGSGTFTPSEALTADILVVAGGGGAPGGTNNAGGGGAGGYIALQDQTFETGNYTVTIGGGGAGNSNATNAGNGSNSVFATNTAIGGGGGARNDAGLSGGSGGGGSADNSDEPGGSGTAGQGNDGGLGKRNAFDPNNAGGGGGAGQVGGNAGRSNAGDGGDGLAWLDGVYRAGGGAGNGAADNQYTASGGLGGGGNSAVAVASGQSGVANTGGGGGSGGGSGGNGGSGVVIVRYAA